MKASVFAWACLGAVVLGAVTFAPTGSAARSYEDFATTVSRLFDEPKEHFFEASHRPVPLHAPGWIEGQGVPADIDYVAIVKEELYARKGNDLPDACMECVVPLAVKACKMAWNKFLAYCKNHTDSKSEEACDRYRGNPKDFLVTRVLRASVNPIDAGYSVCWWRRKCQ